MRKKLAVVLAGMALLVATPVKAEKTVLSQTIAYNSITERPDSVTIESELQDNLAQRRLNPERKRRIRNKIKRAIKRHRRREIGHKIRRAIRNHRRRQVIRGIIGNRICAERGGYWERDRCYYDDYDY